MTALASVQLQDIPVPAVNSFSKNAVWSAQAAFPRNLKIETVFDKFLITFNQNRNYKKRNF